MSKAAVASSGAASSLLARGGRGAPARRRAPVARFDCDFKIWNPFWFTVRGVVRREFLSLLGGRVNEN